MNTNREITQRFAHLENEVTKTRRQMRATWVVALVGTTSAFVLGYRKDAIAQGYGMTLAQAATRIAALETKTQDINRITDPNTNRTTVQFSNVNVQIVDGTGATENTPSGLGNLIIGYNELRGITGINADARTGNHNLVVGSRNNYTGSGGVVFGHYNSISNVGATVTGGAQNAASNLYASVSGGIDNRANGEFSSVSGGSTNIASGDGSSVSGGQQNEASGLSSVSGGQYNIASGPFSSISGGSTNTASGGTTSISGGRNNAASGRFSTISGGPSRTTTTDSGWVAGRFTGTTYTGNFSSP